MKQTLLLFTTLLVFVNIFAQDCNLNEDARKHIARAKGFMAVAEKEADYLDIFKEYHKAFEYAPNCPDICYNLAYCAEMLCKTNYLNYISAICWYKKYLEINPNAPDRDEITNKIYEVEAKQEKYGEQWYLGKFIDNINMKTVLPTWKCGNNLTAVFSTDGTMTISGTGKMRDYSGTFNSGYDNGAPWSCVRHNIKHIEIKEGVTSIGMNAFGAGIPPYWFYRLVSISIPNSVTDIGYNAFGSWKSLKHIYLKSINPPLIQWNTFDESKSNCVLHVPAGSKYKYANADGWKEFVKIIEDQ